MTSKELTITIDQADLVKVLNAASVASVESADAAARIDAIANPAPPWMPTPAQIDGRLVAWGRTSSLGDLQARRNAETDLRALHEAGVIQ